MTGQSASARWKRWAWERGVSGDLVGMAGVAAFGLLVLLSWNPWRLVVVDDLPTWFGVTLLVVVLVAVLAAPFLQSRFVVVKLGWIGLFALSMVVLPLGLAAGVAGASRSDAYFTPDRQTDTHARGITVTRTTGSKWIDGDFCVGLDLQVGHGLTARHRQWFRCDRDTDTWTPGVIDGTDVIVILRHNNEVCEFAIDRHAVNLVPRQAGADCGIP